MEGIIKKFFKDKGYGFIKGSDQKEYFFHVDDLNSPNPQSGDGVKFKPKNSKKGLRAEQVIVDSNKKNNSNNTVSSNTSSANTDRVKCPNCGKTTLPRMIINNNQPSRSVCNHCGGTIKRFGQDIIASVMGIVFFIVVAMIILGNAQ